MMNHEIIITWVIPSLGARVRSWSKNWPNCITMWVNRLSGTSESGWFFWETHRGLGNEDGCRPPRGMPRPSSYALGRKRRKGSPEEPQFGLARLLHRPSNVRYRLVPSHRAELPVGEVFLKHPENQSKGTFREHLRNSKFAPHSILFFVIWTRNVAS